MRLRYQRPWLPPDVENTLLGKNIGFYGTCADAGLPLLDANEIVARLRSFNVTDTTLGLSRVNVAVQLDEGRTRDFNIALARDFIPPDAIRRMLSQPHFRDGAFAWLTPYQIRLAICLLQRFGQRKGGKALTSTESRFEMGHILLSLSDSVRPEIRDIKRPLGEGHLSGQLMVQHTAYKTLDKAVVFELKERTVARLMEETELADEVFRTTGVRPDELFLGVGALWAKFLTHTKELANSSPDCSINLEYLLGLCGLGSSVGDYILANFTQDISQLGGPLADMNAPLYQVSELVDRPLGRLDNTTIICMDIEYMMLRVARCVFNLANEASKASTTRLINARIGTYFEDLCRERVSLIANVRRSAEEYLFDRDLLGDIALDDLYIAGDTAIAFEYKSGYIPMSAAYGTDAVALESQINLKYIEGSSHGKKGFAQLLTHIQSVIRRRHELGLSHIKEFIPCLVVEDDLMTTWPAHTYAIRRAKQIFLDASKFVKHPMIILYDDLGGLLNLSRRWGPANILRGISNARFSAKDFTLKNAILRLYPPSEAERSHGLVDIPRHTPYMDKALSMLEQNVMASVTTPCECGREMVVIATMDGKPCWWCSDCEKRSSKVVSDEIIECQLEQFRTAVDRYRQR